MPNEDHLDNDYPLGIPVDRERITRETLIAICKGTVDIPPSAVAAAGIMLERLNPHSDFSTSLLFDGLQPAWDVVMEATGAAMLDMARDLLGEEGAIKWIKQLQEDSGA